MSHALQMVMIMKREVTIMDVMMMIDILIIFIGINLIFILTQ